MHVLGRLPKLIAIGTYGVACLLWAVLFGVIVSEASLPGDIGGFGAPVKLSCVAQLWYVGMQRAMGCVMWGESGLTMN